MITLEIENPNGERRIVHIAGDRAILGRAPASDVQLRHETVSTKHAQIVREGPAFVLRDLESYNGTYVNGRWIAETTLKFKDKIGIGRFHLTFLTKVPVEPKKRK
ncbi:MAG TPA: FHA domain-containing protein [Planctomycetota bacterium]|jgi:pSer/pThr/pTyr-binding forkhead associated (FHA) protein|nr:FHA domain-containing protein [Planctomycetota bacterium]OQC20030.1 MAG: Glycogen accumulation regulator GarA [Planctomycetes bacterium ADurb.Bin069]HNR99556.1 FHA domain-containing protein [Planctomycetota bacterium]HNU26508.1 FHA domain-containing protein [Planctomycetota bacterium]HOE28420.1 FHA domain-containing protein [Planctomycetota bacterium]